MHQRIRLLSRGHFVWTKPTHGSTDYFNGCSVTTTVNRNFTGPQETFHGNASAGIYAPGPKDYREYLQGEFKQKLKQLVFF